MTKTNPFDDMRKRMAAAYTESRDALSRSNEGVPPYKSKRLSADEEAMAYQFPERMFPKEQMERGQARQALKESMGAQQYVEFIRRNAGK